MRENDWDGEVDVVDVADPTNQKHQLSEVVKPMRSM